MTTMMDRWNKIFQDAQPATYDALKGNGIPADLKWREQIVRRADGRVHCSGAVWWAVCELLRRFTDLEEELGFEHVEEMRKAAWEDLVPTRGDLPILLGEWELGTYSNDRPEAGDICQIWRADGTGHLIICVGEERGRILEWSASKSHLNGTGTKHLSGTPEEFYTFRFDEAFFK